MVSSSSLVGGVLRRVWLGEGRSGWGGRGSEGQRGAGEGGQVGGGRGLRKPGRKANHLRNGKIENNMKSEKTKRAMTGECLVSKSVVGNGGWKERGGGGSKIWLR